MKLPFHLILASQSPRRKALLAEVFPDFEIRVKNTPEDFSDDIPKDSVSEMLAKRKAEAFRNELKPHEVVLTSDTIVLLENTILGKPESAAEAVAMLRSLSGKTHQVITGVCLMSLDKTVSFRVTTNVSFMKLSEEDIQHYVSVYEPFDKAGSYGIQEYIGYVGIDSIEGSYFNVVGLPIHRVVEELRKFKTGFSQ